MKQKRKDNPFFEWEQKTDAQLKKEYRELTDIVKNFRKKHKIRVFLVNRDFKRKGSRKRTTIKREALKRR